MRIFCSICKELFTLFAEVCITKCGHLYHENCLKIWQERSPSCPQCRAKIKGNPARVYFNTEDAQLDSEADVDSLKAKVDNLLETTAELKILNKELETSNANLKDSITKYKEKARLNKETIVILQEKVNVLNKEKEDLLPLKLMNENLKVELKRKTELDTLLKGTENEVREMLSKTPVTSLAVHQLCVYVEALKHQLRKCEEKYKYKNEAAAQMQTYQTALKQSRVMNAEKSLKSNKSTNTLGKMLSDSDEENEVGEGINLKRPSTSSVEHLQELNIGEARSNNALHSNQNKALQKIQGKFVKKVINNLDRPAKKDISSDSSDVEVQIYPGPGKVKKFKSSAARENISIFDKLRNTDNAGPSSVNSGLDVAYDVWGGRRKNPLATPSQIEEIRDIRMRQKNVCLKNSRKILSHALHAVAEAESVFSSFYDSVCQQSQNNEK